MRIVHRSRENAHFLLYLSSTKSKCLESEVRYTHNPKQWGFDTCYLDTLAIFSQLTRLRNQHMQIAHERTAYSQYKT